VRNKNTKLNGYWLCTQKRCSRVECGGILLGLRPWGRINTLCSKSK